MHMYDVIVIGAGAVGCFIARNLSRYKWKSLVIEKENDVGNVTSMANSAIVHSGYDPLPGTKKAYFNVKGNAMFDQISDELDVEFERIGSLTLAFEEKQIETLKDLAKRGEANGVKCKLLNKEETLAIEPCASSEVVGSLLCESAGIINPFTLSAHAMENAIDNGVELKLDEEVIGIKATDHGFSVKTKKGEYEAKVVVNAAGLYSENFAKLFDDIDWKLTPRKGEYFVLDHFKGEFVKHVVFPLPSEKGKGVLVSKTTSGNYIVGPSSEAIKDKDDFSTDSPTLAEVKRQAVNMIPSIPFNQQIRVFSGLRATPSTHDFIIEPSKNNPHFINVAGIESPGLASSPAIGEYVVEELVNPILKEEKNESYNPRIKKYLHPLKMEEKDREALLKANPDYGEIVCNCEKVSLGEIEDVLSRSLPAKTVKAIKKRTRAGFGKCQGGFCQSKVLLLLAKYYGKQAWDVNYDKDGSNPVIGESK